MLSPKDLVVFMGSEGYKPRRKLQRSNEDLERDSHVKSDF